MSEPENIKPFPNIENEPEIDFDMDEPVQNKPSAVHDEKGSGLGFKIVSMLVVLVLAGGVGTFFAHKKGLVEIALFDSLTGSEQLAEGEEKQKSPLEILEDNVNASMQTLGQNMQDFTMSFDNLITDLNNKVAGKANKEEVAVLEQSLTEKFDAANAKLSELGKEIESLKSEQNVKAKKVVRKAKPVAVKKIELPFQIISIDTWNGEPNVALMSSQGKMTILGIGEKRSGWVIDEIEYRNGKVTFRSAVNGVKVKRTVKVM